MAAPILNRPPSITFADTAAADDFADVTGRFTASDTDGNAITYSVTLPAVNTLADSTEIVATDENGADIYSTHRIDATYGTLYYNSNTGYYKYVPDDAKVNAISGVHLFGSFIRATPFQQFSVIATDSNGERSNTQALIVNHHGADDTLVLAPIAEQTIADTAAMDDFADITGYFVATDADTADNPNPVYRVAGATEDTSQSGFTHSLRTYYYGELYYNSGTGEYKYVPNDARINALGAGSNTTTRFSVTAREGTYTAPGQTLTITIRGAKEAPILTPIGERTIADTIAVDDFADLTGSFTITDSRSGIIYSVTGAAELVGNPDFTHSKAGSYGTLFYDKNTGAYKYVPNDAAINALATGER
ncbi:MAG: VCBS domain-containing protein, partial [Alphaproteobacteria bacterium]|nr:VCBS domain-containing protein [Alphaproteobacteria bacterium]